MCSIAVYTISSVSYFDQILCIPTTVNRVGNLIYIICLSALLSTTIRAYDDSSPHDLLMLSVAEEIIVPRDAVVIESTLYVYDWMGDCFWKIDTVNNYRVEKWLSGLSSNDENRFVVRGYDISLSVTNDDHLLVLRLNRAMLFLEMYDQGAEVIKCVSLPNDFSHAAYASQRPNGEFVVSHSLKNTGGKFVSFLSTDGQIIRQYTIEGEGSLSRLQFVLDTDSNNLIAFDMLSGNIYLFDQNTGNWNTVDRLWTRFPPSGYFMVHYDRKKKQFMIASDSNLGIWDSSVRILAMIKY